MWRIWFILKNWARTSISEWASTTAGVNHALKYRSSRQSWERKCVCVSLWWIKASWVSKLILYECVKTFFLKKGSMLSHTHTPRWCFTMLSHMDSSFISALTPHTSSSLIGRENTQLHSCLHPVTFPQTYQTPTPTDLQPRLHTQPTQTLPHTTHTHTHINSHDSRDSDELCVTQAENSLA